jgi:hypothetical protein
MPLQQLSSNSMIIKSTFDSRKCVPCLRAQKTRKCFPPSESTAEAKLERIHSDIFGQFPDSEDNTTYNLMFIDEITRWAHSIDLKDKSSATLKEKFPELVHSRSRTPNWQESQETACRLRRRIQRSTHSNSEVPWHQI